MPKLRTTASTVAEAIAALHHLTLGPDDELAGPEDVRDVLASLSLAMSRMPQLLEQLAVFLEVEYVKGTVAHNQGTTPGSACEWSAKTCTGPASTPRRWPPRWTRPTSMRRTDRRQAGTEETPASRHLPPRAHPSTIRIRTANNLNGGSYRRV